MNTAVDWPQLLEHPGNDHMVQLYQDCAFLVEAVTAYVAAGLRQGEAALLIARPENGSRFAQALELQGFAPSSAVRMLDAEETLDEFMVDGMPEWTAFHRACGGAIAELRLQYPAVRAYGEMVDILWQRGERPAAIRLEEFWNELGRLQTFSLLCTYALDPLAPKSYGAALESVCGCHTHLIPTRDYVRFNEAVLQSAISLLEPPLAQVLLGLAGNHRPSTAMPPGQAVLIWLKRNMPRIADQVLQDVRLRLG